ncbi:hypothetical protein MTR67_022636, partial [Solanum verrucosum]
TFVLEIRSLIGLVGYCRYFIKGIYTITTLLTRLTRLDVPLEWSNECEVSFMKFKEFFTLVLILTLFVEGEGFTVCCDRSISGLGCVLM